MPTRPTPARPNLTLARLALCGLLVLTAAAADPLQGDAVLQRAEERYATALQKAESVYLKVKVDESDKRLRVYRTALEAATRSGDFDKAQALKARIESFDTGVTRAKPKDTIKFAGHEYALIPDKVTWHVAKRRCEEMGGHLVCMETPEEEAAVLAMIRKSPQPTWVGASNEDNVAQWMWVNGRAVSARGWEMNNDRRDVVSSAVVYWPDLNNFSDHDLGERAAFLFECEN